MGVRIQGRILRCFAAVLTCWLLRWERLFPLLADLPLNRSLAESREKTSLLLHTLDEQLGCAFITLFNRTIGSFQRPLFNSGLFVLYLNLWQVVIIVLIMHIFKLWKYYFHKGLFHPEIKPYKVNICVLPFNKYTYECLWWEKIFIQGAWAKFKAAL